ncbi:hypothetical protein A9Q68_08510 [Streptococcus bovimastitidis]|uniref:DUF1642 domain-containing protein n=1 Tax=Streptococcus bovimastitidis TaxID=1856638 RepID=A0A1L8MKC6_9STRE|nr:DUF1642 domain-containing protein [Streptococcus bovimastitidis]OJF71230.1 hypothetical protein A9Q68_08510 [Streptococcus bovimastitidis]
MKIEEYELGQKVSLYGIIEEINIEDIYDKENTTTLSIKTVTGKIHVNPKWEEVKLDQPKPVVPQCAIDWVDNSRERDYEFDEWFDPDNQPLEVYKWLNCKNKRQADINALALVTLIVNGPDAVTVEKEKLYTVEIPNPNGSLFKRFVLCKYNDNGVFINCINDHSWKIRDKFQLTESEIRKDFDWAWQFAKEVTE